MGRKSGIMNSFEALFNDIITYINEKKYHEFYEILEMSFNNTLSFEMKSNINYC